VFIAIVLVASIAEAEDFILTGNQGLIVDKAYVNGKLYDYSWAKVQEGGSITNAYLYNFSTLYVSGGRIDHVYAYGNSVMNVSGGSIGDVAAGITIIGNEIVNISGGMVSKLGAGDFSTVLIYGYDFQTTGGLSLDGQRVVGTGVLTGKWFDGTSWTTTIYLNDGIIQVVPEPSSLLALLCGLGGISGMMRKRR